MLKELNEWLSETAAKRIFQMLEYRRPGDWTPFEIEHKFIYESQYKNIIQI